MRAHVLAAVAALVLGAIFALHVAEAGQPTRAEVDVSNIPGPQTNPTITVDPRDNRVLLAGSNSFLEGVERVYSSVDGGRTWTTSTLTPAVTSLDASCSSDPSVAIDRKRRQYFSFDRSTPCTGDAPSRVYVATRP